MCLQADPHNIAEVDVQIKVHLMFAGRTVIINDPPTGRMNSGIEYIHHNINFSMQPLFIMVQPSRPTRKYQKSIEKRPKTCMHMGIIMVDNLFTDKRASHTRLPSAAAGVADAAVAAGPGLALERAAAVSADPDLETRDAGGHPWH